MSKENKSLVLLITTDRQQIGTQTVIRYSAVFAREKHSLDPVEAQVFDMVKEYPDCWNCGCVTGYPEHMFTPADQEYFDLNGINKRFVR